MVRRVLSAIAVAALAVACASSPAGNDQIVLRVLMADDWASAPAVGDAIDEFEREHDGVRVQVQGSPFSRIPELVDSSLELDQPYDLAHWHAFAAASAGIAEPVDDLWAEAGLTDDEYLDGAVEDVTWLGERYGVPLDVNALVLLVNRGAAAAAEVDLDDLSSVHGFRAAAEKVVAEGVVEHAIPVSASSWAAYGWIVANGGEVVTIDGDTGDPTFTFDDPRTIEAVGLLGDFVRTELAPPPFASDLALDAVQSFAQGEVAMYATGSWDLPVTRRADGTVDVDEDVAILPLPQREPGDVKTVLGGSSLFVPRGAEHRELAFQLALRLTEDATAMRLAQEEGRLPARARVYAHDAFQASPLIAAFVEQLANARVMPLIAYPEVAEAFREGLESVLAGRQSAEEAMRDLQGFAESTNARG